MYKWCDDIYLPIDAAFQLLTLGVQSTLPVIILLLNLDSQLIAWGWFFLTLNCHGTIMELMQ